MSRPVQPGDFVTVSYQEQNSRFQVSEIKTEGIYIHPLDQPQSDPSLLITDQGEWKVYGTDLPYQLTFTPAETVEHPSDITWTVTIPRTGKKSVARLGANCPELGWIIKEVLGYGNQAITYVACKTVNDTEICDAVVKVSFEGIVEDPEDVPGHTEQEIQNEIQFQNMAADLGISPKISGHIHCEDFFIDNEQKPVDIIVMDRIYGETLDKQPEKKPFWDAASAEYMFRLHNRGIFHGDAGPHNVIIDANNRVWIIDYGNAQWLNNPSSSYLASKSLAYRILLDLDTTESPDIIRRYKELAVANGQFDLLRQINEEEERETVENAAENAAEKERYLK